MSLTRRAALTGALALMLAACGRRDRESSRGNFNPPLYPNETPEIRRAIEKYSREYDVPETLFHRVIQRESGYNPNARNGPYYGLMQILPQTARTMGFIGNPRELLNADTNLKYAGKYLRGAWLVSKGNESRAVKWYASGYYYEAKRMGLLEETGLRG